MKRLFNLLLSSSALLLLLVALLICAIAVGLTSKGPIFYVSDRVGANNSHFDMLKFRTMDTEASKVATHLTTGPKTFLTLIVDVLRKSSLKELTHGEKEQIYRMAKDPLF